LHRLPEVASVTQLGARLRVLVPESVGEPLSLVDQALKARGLAAETSLVQASLEDVFVAVTLDARDEAA
jgi:ABC-2 type transport system ATP-binding protein